MDEFAARRARFKTAAAPPAHGVCLGREPMVTVMDRVFVYWDNSNVFHEAQRLADQLEGTPEARYLVRIHFDNLLRLAHADRPLAKAVAAG